MTKQFYVFKTGKTINGPVLIFSRNTEHFNFELKVSKYKELGYKVFNLNMEQI